MEGDTHQLPLWLWHEYPEGVPSYIEFNLRALRQHAVPHFKVHVLNSVKFLRLAGTFVPKEFQFLPYAAARADVARTLLLAKYGGLWIDADFLVMKPLRAVWEQLARHELVSYTVDGQGCSDGVFSLNFVGAARGNTSYWNACWAAELDLLHRSCTKRRCHMPWGSTGARIWHTVGRQSAARGQLDISCFQGSTSLAPVVQGRARISVLDVQTTPLCGYGGTIANMCCSKQGLHLRCVNHRNQTGQSLHFFDRLAYHLFESIHGPEYNSSLGACGELRREDAPKVVSLLYAQAAKVLWT